MRTLAWMVVSALAFLSGCSPVAQCDVAPQGESFIQAWNNHDSARIEAMLSDDVVWDGMGYLNCGPEAILGFAAFDEVVDTQFEIRRVVAKGDTVYLDLIERSELFRTLGVPEVGNSLRLVFGSDGIQWITEDPITERGASLDDAFASLLVWAQAERSEVVSSLPLEDGEPRICAETGVTLLLLAREWRRQKDGGPTSQLSNLRMNPPSLGVTASARGSLRSATPRATLNARGLYAVR